MDESKIIAISHKVKWLDIHPVARSGKFMFIPAINYKLNTNGPKLVNYPIPFQLFPRGLSMELLIRYCRPDIDRKEEFKIAQKAYQQMKSFATRCAERVIADLICGLILQYSSPYKGEDIIYIIEGPPSNKLMGRLGYLYLPIKKLSIFFISFKPEDIMTNLMQYQTGRLEFDLYKLISEENENSKGPYPGNPTETLKQTYFYRPPKEGREMVFPIRIDIFSQGLLESDFGDKEKILDKLLEDHLTPPFKLKEGIFIKIPKELKDCLDAWELHERQLESLLKKESS